jgi:hypothetical protein
MRGHKRLETAVVAVLACSATLAWCQATGSYSHRQGGYTTFGTWSADRVPAVGAQRPASDGAAEPAAGPAAVLTSISGPEAEAILRAAGFSPEWRQDSDGDPLLRCHIDDSLFFYVVFYGVQQGRASSLQFSAAFSAESTRQISPDTLNQWNRTKRWLKAYQSEQGRVLIDMDIGLSGGIQRGYLEERLKTWRSSLTQFALWLSMARQGLGLGSANSRSY